MKTCKRIAYKLSKTPEKRAKITPFVHPNAIKDIAGHESYGIYARFMQKIRKITTISCIKIHTPDFFRCSDAFGPGSSPGGHTNKTHAKGVLLMPLAYVL